MFRFSLILLFALTTSLAQAEDSWPQFRGPSGQGHSGATGLPSRWSETENIVWKIPVAGRGWSSPVVMDNRVWLTTGVQRELTKEEREKKLADDPFKKQLAIAASVSLRAVCIDLKSGSVLHDVELFSVTNPDPIHYTNTYASPTPVIENGRVYCHFGSSGTACVDASSGKVLWKRQLVIAHKVGAASSPVVHGDLLFLNCDGADVQYVAALDKQTGETVWKTNRRAMIGDRGDLHKAFSTPLMIQVAGKYQLVSPGAQWVIAYEPATGKEIWRASYGKGFSNVPRPVFGHGRVFICTGFMSHQLWAIRVDGQGDVTESHVDWKETKQIPDKPSPLLLGDEIYIISARGIASCLDAHTGKNLWKERMPGNYSASPLYADGKIYFCSEDGKTTIIKPGKEYTELAINQLDGQLRASPAVVGRALLLRTDSHLYRIEEKAAR